MAALSTLSTAAEKALSAREISIPCPLSTFNNRAWSPSRGSSAGNTQAAGPSVRKRLLTATEAFEAVLRRQGRALAASKTITEGLVKAIAEEVTVRRNVGQAYGPKATRPPAAATAITLNQQA